MKNKKKKNAKHIYQKQNKKCSSTTINVNYEVHTIKTFEHSNDVQYGTHYKESVYKIGKKTSHKNSETERNACNA